MSNNTGRITDLSSEQKRALLARLVKERARETDPLSRPFHRLFEAQAKRTPESVAVGFEGRTLTYSDLNARANQLASRLRSLGVGPEVMVGLCVERGLDMVVGLLGVLKAGGAYVPIDPAFPPQRIAFMLEDARVPVIVTEDPLRDRLDVRKAEVVFLDSDLPAIGNEPAVNLEGGATDANIAYVIYTSGSTGQPKGVMISHRALTNFLISMRQQPGLSETDTLLAVTTLSFDIAVLELLLPLTLGARVEIVGRDVATDGVRLATAIKSLGVTVMQATPATWRLLLDSGWEGSPTLKVLCGGEALNLELAERLLGKTKEVWNLYGPTETTIWSTLAKLEPGQSSVPIGRPIANTRAYILDAHLRPVPIGISGELYLGGSGLARGYLRRPELTAERFVTDQYGPEPGERLYRTGDLARYRPDGVLECQGRVDSQVKIRGYRVELGEIEAALAGHPAVRESAALAKQDPSGENQLVGYIVPRGELAPSVAELKTWLKDRLPDYMVPSVYVVLKEMPLTPNGKIDRKTLPDPGSVSQGNSEGMTPPRGPVEEALVALWGEILSRDGLGVYDNFFEVGGHSLLAAQLLARVRELFAVEIPLKSFFDDATVSSLGHQVEDALRLGVGLKLPPLVAVPRTGPMPASFAQQRLWFLDQMEPGNPTYNIPTVVRLNGVLDVLLLRAALQELVRRQESLRTTFASEGGVPIQVIAPSLDLELPLDDLTGLPEAERETEVRRLVQEESWRPFDLAHGPLIRARLFKLGSECHLVSVVIHHIVSDGWSTGVLIREVGTHYEAFVRNEPSPLPIPVIQYADFAVWQRNWLQGETLQSQLDYWRDLLSGVPVLELPTDRPRPAVASGRGATRFRLFPKALIDQLRTFGRAEGSTLFMSLLTGFESLLSRYSGQTDFAVGSPIAGRTWPQTEGLIGFFVNTLVLRADLSGEPSFRELLSRTRKKALETYAHQDLPFEQLVGLLHPERDPSRAPIFQVMFVLQNAPLPALKSPGLEMTPVEVESLTAKFDLTLSMIETSEGLNAALEFNTDIFDEATVDRLLGHFQTLLESAVAEPDRPVATLTMLTEAEQRMLLGWNLTGAGQGAEPPIDAETEDALADLDNLSDDELDALLNRM